MSLAKKVFFILVSLITLAVIGGFVYVHSIAKRSLPHYDGSLYLNDLIEPVQIYRDQYAVPHIIAQNESDLYKAVGYTLGQDRLWQMDLLRRVTLGRLSEIFGPDLIDVDLLMRSLKIPEKSTLILSKSDPDIIAALENFSNGLNQFIETHQNKLPPEFTILGYRPEKWKPEHSVNLLGYMAWDLTFSYPVESLLHKINEKVTLEQYKELIPDTMSPTTPIYKDFTANTDTSFIKFTVLDTMDILEKYGISIFKGSNSWTISGEKSKTGKPIFANDMHLGLNAPGLWYQMHQMVKGKLNVTGVNLPGQPFILAGHNDKIAWGMTNVMVDDMDFYEEKINPKNPDQYQFLGEWKNFEIKSETIQIKGNKPIIQKNRFTHRGPVISRFKNLKNKTISMKWLGNEYSDEVSAIYKLNRAENWEDFKSAVRTFSAVSQNINYADIDGNIGLYCCAGVPIRKKGNGVDIVPGWTDEYDWKGLVPFEQLPHSYNPENGFVSSANNKTVSNDYPYYISHWFALEYRIDRIRELLIMKKKLAIEDVKNMQADFESKLVKDLKPFILSIVSNKNITDENEKKAIKILEGWNDILDKKSSAALIFETLYVNLVKNLIHDDLGDDLYKEFSKSTLLHRYLIKNIIHNKTSTWADDKNTTNIVEDFSMIMKNTFSQTIAELTQKYGDKPASWEWGNIHKLRLKHPLGTVKILDTLFGFNDKARKIGGSFHTVCPLAYNLVEPFVVNHGASQRHIYTIGDWDKSISVIPTGISGIPASDHYCDQTQMYVENQYHPDLFTLNEIQKNAKYHLTIHPTQ